MSAYTQELAKEKENKKKSKRFAIWIHLILLGLAAFPFLTPGTDKAPEFQSVIEIDFRDFEKQASKKSSQAAHGKIKKQKKRPAPNRASLPKPEVKKKPKRETAPAKKPVVTTPEPAPVIETSPVEKPEEAPNLEPLPIPEEAPVEVVEDAAPQEPMEDAGSPDATAAEGNGTGVGNDADGSADEANNGTANEGNNGMDFSGDGLLNRPVIFRADVKKLAKEEGKIVVNICVSRAGRVVYAKYNKEESTITTMNIIRKAIATAQKYKFKRDSSLPNKQCGKLSFIFQIEKE